MVNINLNADGTQKSLEQQQTEAAANRGDSPTAKAADVQKAYKEFLGRDAGQAEIDMWAGGESVDVIREWIAASPEATAFKKNQLMGDPVAIDTEDLEKQAGITPTFFQTAGGMTKLVQAENGEWGYIFEEDAVQKAQREKDQTLLNEVLNSLGVVSGERQAGIDEVADTFQKEFLRQTETPLSNALIGKGLRGSSIYKEALVDLFTKAGTQSTLLKEDLYARDENAKLNLANSLRSGYNADQQLSLQSSSLGSGTIFGGQQLASQNLQNIAGLQLQQSALNQGTNQFWSSFLENQRQFDLNLKNGDSSEPQSTLWSSILGGVGTVVGGIYGSSVGAAGGRTIGSKIGEGIDE